jgi:hypothetical protein
MCLPPLSQESAPRGQCHSSSLPSKVRDRSRGNILQHQVQPRKMMKYCISNSCSCCQRHFLCRAQTQSPCTRTVWANCFFFSDSTLPRCASACWGGLAWAQTSVPKSFLTDSMRRFGFGRLSTSTKLPALAAPKQPWEQSLDARPQFLRQSRDFALCGLRIFEDAGLRQGRAKERAQGLGRGTR